MIQPDLTESSVRYWIKSNQTHFTNSTFRSHQSWLGETFENQGSTRGAVGKYVNISLYKAVEKQKVFEGNLVGFEEDVLTIEYMDKTRKKTVDIPYNLVSKARLAVNCNRMKEGCLYSRGKKT